MPTDEEKLLAILEQSVDEVVSEAAPELDEKQRATLQRIFDKAMPTPEEIARDAKINEHNAEVRQRREADLAKRRERRANNPKKRRRRR